jgi:hypothetical protein
MNSLAGALLNICRARGDSGTWYNRNDSGYTCYFAWGNRAAVNGDTMAGAIHDIEETTITMPYQSGTTGNEPSPGDLLADSSGRYWQCLNVQKLGLPMSPCGYQCQMRREPEVNRING